MRRLRSLGTDEALRRKRGIIAHQRYLHNVCVTAVYSHYNLDTITVNDWRICPGKFSYAADALTSS